MGQTLSFQITANSNAALFAVAPAVNPTGTLSYTPAANANGTATLSLVIKDNGGTANGGVDTSAAQSFTITVGAVSPGFIFQDSFE
ncbi:MAG: Ig-like domain-containing protein [Gammaproteobacteria bacterium]